MDGPAPPPASTASNASTNMNTNADTNQPHQRPRAPRGRNHPPRGSSHEAADRDPARGHARGRGRGAGPQRRHRRLSSASQHIDPTKPLLSPKERSTSVSDASAPNGLTATPQADDPTALAPAVTNGSADEPEVCFICASPVIHYAVAPCNHITCHICALRLRALYKTKACAHCRTNAEFVVFTDSADKRFEEFVDADVVRTDTNLGIKYEKPEILEDTVLLLRYNCPDPNCDVACYGWPDLHRHVRNVHHRVMCDLCTRNKKVFTHEHELFTHAQLRKHEKHGDDNPGAVDQSGFRGHPECGFCRERFYGDDELYTHCRDKHERCHICDRIHPGRQQQYYLDYSQLEVHFRKDHFLCPDQECLDKKFVVFESEMDLKAHQLEAHPNGLSKDARRDARRVDMSGFDYRQGHQDSRGQRREAPRGRGRGRDPNVDPLPASSAQPLRRDELAFQRQLAIHSAQSVSNRTFGGQLSSSADTYAAAPVNANEPITVTATPGNQNSSSSSSTNHDQALPSLQELTIDNNRSLSPASRARAVRHNAVLERASNLLGNDASSISSFRNYISQYRNSAITASGLIDSFFTLFDTAKASPSEIGTLIKELADIFEVAGKKEALLKAWNDWRAINEDYPSLPGPASATGPKQGTSSGKRILKLKSSTAQSNRNAAARSTWGNVAGSVSNASPSTLRNNSVFPPMPASSSLPASSSRPAWVAVGPGLARSNPNTSRTSTSSNTTRPTPSSSSKAPAADAFPALPAAQKPAMNVLRPGYTGNPRLQRGSGSSTPVSAWNPRINTGGGDVAAAIEASLAEGADEEVTAGAKSKGKGKGKKLVMHWG